mmetsp:Transcript_84911/g.235481  ORF Transcript_84911/g.235481 Transcript_84911/m.235481 type:complete len:215 (-) Transcript_84911:470-1114(-)
MQRAVGRCDLLRIAVITAVVPQEGAYRHCGFSSDPGWLPFVPADTATITATRSPGDTAHSDGDAIVSNAGHSVAGLLVPAPHGRQRRAALGLGADCGLANLGRSGAHPRRDAVPAALARVGLPGGGTKRLRQRASRRCVHRPGCGGGWGCAAGGVCGRLAEAVSVHPGGLDRCNTRMPANAVLLREAVPLGPFKVEPSMRHTAGGLARQRCSRT